MTSNQIIKSLPYQQPFLFVDKLTEISSEGITGNYTFKAIEYFYKGHFKNNPITPGVTVFPNEKVTVISEKEFYRFNKLKCHVKMLNEKNELVCRGVISGMIKPTVNET